MRAIARRLHRLEQRLGPPVESRETRAVLARLEAARLRHGLPPISPERTSELRVMSITQILNAARQRAAVAHQRESSAPHPDLTRGTARQAEQEGKTV